MTSIQTNLIVHFVFSTKDQLPLIDSTWEPQLHDSLENALEEQGAQSLGIGGGADHVQLLVNLDGAKSIDEVVREVKTSSQDWINQHTATNNFAWQTSYCAFSISPEESHSAQESIRNQHSHRHNRSFKEELLETLKEYQIEYKPEYLD